MSDKPIPEKTRRSIFAAVVEAQDRGESLQESRKNVSEAFGITVDQLREIEEEGIDNTWPPLEPCDDEE